MPIFIPGVIFLVLSLATVSSPTDPIALDSKIAAAPRYILHEEGHQPHQYENEEEHAGSKSDEQHQGYVNANKKVEDEITDEHSEKGEHGSFGEGGASFDKHHKDHVADNKEYENVKEHDAGEKFGGQALKEHKLGRHKEKSLGHKVHGFKNVYHKEEYGDHKTFHDEFLDNDHIHDYDDRHEHRELQGGKFSKGYKRENENEERDDGDEAHEWGKNGYKGQDEGNYERGGHLAKHNHGHKKHEGHHQSSGQRGRHSHRKQKKGDPVSYNTNPHDEPYFKPSSNFDHVPNSNHHLDNVEDEHYPQEPIHYSASSYFGNNAHSQEERSPVLSKGVENSAPHYPTSVPEQKDEQQRVPAAVTRSQFHYQGPHYKSYFDRPGADNYNDKEHQPRTSHHQQKNSHDKDHRHPLRRKNTHRHNLTKKPFNNDHHQHQPHYYHKQTSPKPHWNHHGNGSSPHHDRNTAYRNFPQGEINSKSSVHWSPEDPYIPHHDTTITNQRHPFVSGPYDWSQNSNNDRKHFLLATNQENFPRNLQNQNSYPRNVQNAVHGTQHRHHSRY